MLTGNLATRPFYNERLVRGVLIVALAAAAAWAAVNAATLVSLSQQSAMLSERVRTEALRAAAARTDADGVRRGLDVAELKNVSRAATEANQLILQRTFSWTELFNQFEATLPPDVRLVQVQPQADADGRLMVALTVISRRIEDLDTFIDRLEATGTFRGVLSRSDEALEDGTIESNLQGYYRHAANPAPATSEPKSAAATSARAEGAMTEARGVVMRRVLREHRAWIWPLAVLVALNVVAVVAGVLPMSSSVRSAGARATSATADAEAALAELKAATAARDGRDTATRELSLFYRDVLPANVAAARRLLQLRVAQLARAHEVTFSRSAAAPENIRGSDLARLQASIELVGRYRDVRDFLYELETADDFVVVDSIVLAEGDDPAAPLDLTLVVSTYFKAIPDVPERQRHALMGLLAVLVVAAGWRYLGAPAADAPAAAATARRAEQAAAPVPPVDVRLDTLDNSREGPDEIERNPFVFGARVAAPVPRSDTPITTAPSPVVLPPGPPPVPPIPFKFIGLVEGAAGTRRIAVLSDSKGLVVHGGEGAIIDGRFRILSIGPESIEIAYADGRGRQTLRLSGQ